MGFFHIQKNQNLPSFTEVGFYPHPLKNDQTSLGEKKEPTGSFFYFLNFNFGC
jgi:hypothetical protein